MNNFFKKYKENLVGNIALTISLICTIVHLTIITLSAFDLTTFSFYDGFSYIVAFSLIVISLCIYILGFFIEKIFKLKIPSWFQVVFYIAFFLFTNTYYILNAFISLPAIIFFFAYISFLSTIANVSIFYNIQKDEKNRLVASKKYILASIFFYSTGTNAIIAFLISAVKVLFFPRYDLTMLNIYVVEFCTMLLVTLIMCVIFSISLRLSKRIINACLIIKH